MTLTDGPRAQVLAYCQVHVEPFTQHAAAIGLSPTALTNFVSATQEHAEAESQLEAARIAYAAAASHVKRTYVAMTTALSQSVAMVRQHAVQTRDINVYNLAQVPPIAKRSKMPAPGAVHSARAKLQTNTGAIVLSWKTSNPQNAKGTSYVVRRKLAQEQDFAFVGITGDTSFQDAPLPAGTLSVQYTITAQRGKLSSEESPIVTVHVNGARPANLAVSQALAA